MLEFLARNLGIIFRFVVPAVLGLIVGRFVGTWLHAHGVREWWIVPGWMVVGPFFGVYFANLILEALSPRGK